MSNIDRIFWDMTKNLTNLINFPKEAFDIGELKSFLFKYGKRLFVLPEYYYRQSLTGSDESLMNWRKFSYLNQKRIIMDLFLDELAYRSWFKVDNLRYLLMLSDLLRSDEMEYSRHKFGSGKNNYYRDHVLHTGYVFIWGLWMYINFKHVLEDLYKDFLDKNPLGKEGAGALCNGCRALGRVNVNVGWQFFQQWFLTSIFHDIGYFLEDREIKRTIKYKNKMLEHVNNFGKRSLGAEYDNYKANIGGTNNLNLMLHNIVYPSHPAEGYISDNIWNECLDRITGSGWTNDHGVYSAAIFLKIGNILTKYLELRDRQSEPACERDPWKRNSYRNYIVPTDAIAKHNTDYYQAKGKKYVNPINGQDLSVKISIDDFLDDFLATMLVAADAIAGFDRIGGREPLLGIEYDIRKVDEKNTINFIIYRITQSN